MGYRSYDPDPSKPYGRCLNCGLTLETEDHAKEHRRDTMAPGKASHLTRAENPPRYERIQNMVDDVVQGAIEDAIERLREEVARANVSSGEILGALAWYSSFSDAWESDD